ncbi:hypothetical protein SKAU_G00013980 [Synaphobranchus kaupii]|uniref:Uncharacterized protein n=1 Tax=Synaphobranchus kaupii TaxID=118154 RepID=A0A9Q1GBP3_SYNKA|nr:hypothetical protein SKAU_G00013980 [Synaphobranchus kaupii]
MSFQCALLLKQQAEAPLHEHSQLSKRSGPAEALGCGYPSRRGPRVRHLTREHLRLLPALQPPLQKAGVVWQVNKSSLLRRYLWYTGSPLLPRLPGWCTGRRPRGLDMGHQALIASWHSLMSVLCFSSTLLLGSRRRYWRLSSRHPVSPAARRWVYGRQGLHH